MNSADKYFKIATYSDNCGGLLFYIAFAASLTVTIWDNSTTEAICHPILILAAVFAIASTVVTSIYQTGGNRCLRASQLSHALGAGVGERVRPDYYNNNLPQTLLKLAATTLENTLNTKATLSTMAWKMRFQCGFYVILFLVLCTSRSTPTSWLLVMAQTLFSADLVLKLIRLERFRVRTRAVYERLVDFFSLTGDAERPNHLAILVGSFADYECAKDEASLPLDLGIFEKKKQELTQEWEELKVRLRIP